MSSAAQASDKRSIWSPGAARLASVVLFGVLPGLTLCLVFVGSIQSDDVATDFRQFYGAASAILRGESPYLDSVGSLTVWGGPYPYPPLPALLAIPLTALPLEAAGLLVMVVLVGVAMAVPGVLGVRDWRCYGLLLLWPPVISAIQTGNVTLLFALAAAVAWRVRDRPFASSASIGLTLAAKFFLWPLVVWLAATRRMLGALLACAVGVAVLALSWLVIGFAGMADYPDLLRRLDRAVGEDSYTVYIVGLDLGLPSAAARAAWLTVGLLLVLGVVVLGRHGDEQTAFVVAIAASLALMPIVWLHYFALLLVVVALAQPRLGYAWFLPLAMFITPGSGHPSPFDTAWALGIAALTVAVCVRESRAAMAPRGPRFEHELVVRPT